MSSARRVDKSVDVLAFDANGVCVQFGCDRAKIMVD
ncbi:hypothetical protein QFZ97_004566 [Paraburkholderia youngii]